MRELNDDESNQVAGGILPVVGFGIALVGKAMGSSGVAGWAVSSASLVLASYSMGEYFLSQD